MFRNLFTQYDEIHDLFKHIMQTATHTLQTTDILQHIFDCSVDNVTVDANSGEITVNKKN